METEHRCRYWWAAQVARDRDVLDAGCGVGYGMTILADAGAASVTGVDIDPGSVAEADRRVGDRGAVSEADLRELPFPDGSFDLVVCWETIEHIDGGERTLEELGRVLRSDGLLLVSSPNPGVYAPGNEHHVHEYRPTELVSALQERFSHVARYRQHPWLVSAVEAVDGGGAALEPNGANGHGDMREIRATDTLEQDGETYSVIVAGDAPLPVLRDLIALGSDFEVRWWEEAVRSVEAERQRIGAVATARETELVERLRQTSAALLDANRLLAQVPAIQHHLEEARSECHELRERIAIYERSKSWRLMAPLRRLANLFRQRQV